MNFIVIYLIIVNYYVISTYLITYKAELVVDYVDVRS